jgi:RNA polymerase sigma-70 factor (ECF subfamily)
MTNTLPDEELVEKVLRRDENAYSELYDRYRRPIYAIAYRIIQNSQDAQDITQEIFIKIFRSLSIWDPEKAKFSTWLFRLAANHAIDCWRAKRRRLESQFPGESTEKADWRTRIGDAIRSPYGEVEQKENVETIRQCTDSLPELQKKVFVLRYFHDLKLGEIAEMEGCSLGTVKTSLFRGTQAVRRAIRRSRGMK